MTEYLGPERRMEQINRHEFDGMSRWVKDIDEKMILHTTQEIRMEQRLDQLEKDVHEIKQIVTELRDIWTQSKGALKLITIIISVLGAGWTLLTWGKDHVKL